MKFASELRAISEKTRVKHQLPPLTCRPEDVEVPSYPGLLPFVRQLHSFQVLSVRSLVLGLAHIRLETKRHNGFLKASSSARNRRLRNVACIIARQDDYNAHTRRIKSNYRKRIPVSRNSCRQEFLDVRPTTH